MSNVQERWEATGAEFLPGSVKEGSGEGGTKRYMPFSVGPRQCIGQSLAHMMASPFFFFLFSPSSLLLPHTWASQMHTCFHATSSSHPLLIMHLRKRCHEFWQCFGQVLTNDWMCVIIATNLML